MKKLFLIAIILILSLSVMSPLTLNTYKKLMKTYVIPANQVTVYNIGFSEEDNMYVIFYFYTEKYSKEVRKGVATVGKRETKMSKAIQERKFKISLTIDYDGFFKEIRSYPTFITTKNIEHNLQIEILKNEENNSGT